MDDLRPAVATGVARLGMEYKAAVRVMSDVFYFNTETKAAMLTEVNT